MNIKVFVDESYCQLAVAHAIHTDTKVRSRKAFLGAVSHYLLMYGSLCMDDHEGEYRQYNDEAIKITNKYYK